MRITTDDGGEIDLVGAYQAIERPERIVFFWRWEDNPNFNPCESVVEITLGEHTEGTLMRLVQTGIEDDEDRANHVMGWSSTLNKLEKIFH